MKKFFVLLFSQVFFMMMIFAQTSGQASSQTAGGAGGKSFASSANHNTALRCLKLAENCLVGKDWTNAEKQTDLALTYDDSISDLYYVKAAAWINQGKNRAQVLPLIEKAFEKENWLGYNKNGARILYADLLSDTGLYSQSLSFLDSNPLIYSADAEFIRIKNYYRMNTQESVNNARLKLNTSRRVYPSDSRFPRIFFMFEYMYMNYAELQGRPYEIPEIVQTVANFYIQKLPDYSDSDTELEILAAFFASGDEQVRLARAIEAKSKSSNSLLSLLALKTGIYSDSQAYDSFMEASDNAISLRNLETLLLNLSDDQVKDKALEKLLNYDGSIFIDNNLDLQEEIKIEYETGRPLYIKYDQNDDGLTDLYATCDFGSPLLVYFEENRSEVFYDKYPSVSKISFLTEKFDFNFLHDEYYFLPFELKPDSIISLLGLDFYIPDFARELDENGGLVSQKINPPNPADLIKKTSSVDLPITERENAVVKYQAVDGRLVYANFYENDRRYAYCDFSQDYPIYRYVDYDNDDYFETTETYDLLSDDGDLSDGGDDDEGTVDFSLYDKAAIQGVFSAAIGDAKVYLKKVAIDRNGNTFYEFSQQFLEKGGKITLWDNDDNGVWDCQYIRYPKKDDDSLIEETIFFDTNGLPLILPLITLTLLDAIPVKMIYKNSEVMIYAGQNDNLYWIEEEGSVEMEDEILNFVNAGGALPGLTQNNAPLQEGQEGGLTQKSLTQGAINLLEYEGSRISVIKVSENYYCKILPESEVQE